VDTQTEPHSACGYVELDREPEYRQRMRFFRLMNHDWRDDWIRRYTESQRHSPYHEAMRLTFEKAKVRAAEKVRDFEMQTRRERDTELREYKEKTKWTVEHTPVTSDTYYAKYDPGIRIVPVDERIAAPFPLNAFYNPGSQPWIP
jgi:hypothetical protein